MRELVRDDSGQLRNGWKLLGFLALFLGLGVALRAAAALLRFEVLPGTGRAIWLSAGGALAATVICTGLEGVRPSSIGLRLDLKWIRELALGALLGAAMIGLTLLGIWALGGLQGWNHTSDGTAPWGMAGLFLAIALKEELLFRGYFFQRAARGMGPWPAQLLVAALFIAAHAANPAPSSLLRWSSWLNMLLASVLYGLLVLRTGSLALPIGSHFAWNFTQSVLGFNVTGTASPGPWTPRLQGPDWLTGGGLGPEASVACHAALVLAIALVWASGTAKHRWSGRPRLSA